MCVRFAITLSNRNVKSMDSLFVNRLNAGALFGLSDFGKHLPKQLPMPVAVHQGLPNFQPPWGFKQISEPVVIDCC